MSAEISRWLAAREATEIRDAWRALSPVKHDFARTLTIQDAIAVAAKMLGERPDWLTSVATRPRDEDRQYVASYVFLDDVWEITDDLDVYWYLHQVGGVQHIYQSVGTRRGRPEGGGNTIVRVTDGTRAASIRIDGRTISTVGDVDLSVVT